MINKTSDIQGWVMQIHFYALLKMSKICALKTPNTFNAEPSPWCFCVPARSCSVEHFLHSLAVARRWSHLPLYFCRAGAALLLLLPRSVHWRALILVSTGCRSASSAVHLTTPQAGLMCRKCLLMQEAPAYAVLVQV